MNHALQSNHPVSAARLTRFQTPRENGGVLAAPPLVEAKSLAFQNSADLNASAVQIAGRSLKDFRAWTRACCIEAAQHWMTRVLGVSVDSQPGLLFVTGHQPTLNHPGVWSKNVIASHLAKCSATTGLNLIVDNDLAGPSSIRVPAGTLRTPQFEFLEYDSITASQPWEERRVENIDLLKTFPERVNAAMSNWGIHPVLEECWPVAARVAESTQQISPALTAGRIELERQHHVENLELPVSEMCQTLPFLAFVKDIVQQHERFFDAYNDSVTQYRETYGVRNHRHPVPNLERDGHCVELPFWYWTAGATDRARVFVERRNSEQLVLTANGVELATLSAKGHDLSALQQLQSVGKLRTRALTTTLFARLCFADLFIHGIGGAKYDEITDQIFERFYGIDAPKFLTVTATLRLPIPAQTVTAAEVEQATQKIHSLKQQGPQGNSSQEVTELKAELARLIHERESFRNAGLSKSERKKRRPETRQRHLRLRAVQTQLQSFAEIQVQDAIKHREELELCLKANAVLMSREYSSCLFPQQNLSQFVSVLKGDVCGNKFKKSLSLSALQNPF